MYVPDIGVAQFFSGDACKAAGIDGATLKNWMTREPPALLVSEEDRAKFREQGFDIGGAISERLAGGSGRSHLFTYRRVMQMALVAEMVALGLSPRRAGTLALGFSDVGEAVAYWGGGPAPEIPRWPGELFPEGRTVLVAYPGDDHSQVINVPAGKPTYSVLEALRVGTRRSGSAIIVDVNVVDDRVRASLGLDRNWARRPPGGGQPK